MKVTKIGTINNGIDGLEHYYNVVTTEGQTKEQAFDELHAQYYYPSRDVPGSKFISSMHLIETIHADTFIFLINEKYDI